MKTMITLLAVLLALFLTVVTASAQYKNDPIPPADSFTVDPFAPVPPDDPFAPPPPPPGGGYYKSGGGPPGGGPPGGGPPGGWPPGGGPPGGWPPGGGGGGGHSVPEPSTLILLGIGLAAGGVYSFFRHQKSKKQEQA